MGKQLSLCVPLVACLFMPVLSYAASTEDMNDLRNMDIGPAHQWNLVKNDNMRNIKTFSKQEDGKKVRSFRVEMMVDAPLEAVARVHFDADNIKRWFWETMDSRMLKKVSATEYYYYQKFNAPLTMPDRDSILHVVLEPYTTKKGFMLITISAAPDFMPVQSGLVRVTAQDMVIKLTPVAKEKTRLEAEGYIDPGGVSPAWAVNAIQRTAPYNSMVGLQRVVQLPVYREATGTPAFAIYGNE